MKEGGTEAVVGGGQRTPAGEVSDWRGMVGWVNPVSREAKVITTDASLCEYYLARADYVFPYVYLPEIEKDPVTGTVVLKDATSFLEVLNGLKEAVILVSEAKKRKVLLRVPEGERIRAALLAGESMVWQSPTESAIQWDHPGGVFSGNR